MDDLTLRLEYTRILPWVYSNFIQTQTYTNSGYLLGDYIGQNADQLYARADYRLNKGLNLALWAEQTRQGGMDSVVYQYQPEAEPFLYGPQRKELAWGIQVRDEIFLNLVAQVDYQYQHVSDEDPLRTPAYQLGTHHSLGLTLYYFL